MLHRKWGWRPTFVLPAALIFTLFAAFPSGAVASTCRPIEHGGIKFYGVVTMKWSCAKARSVLSAFARNDPQVGVTTARIGRAKFVCDLYDLDVDATGGFCSVDRRGEGLRWRSEKYIPTKNRAIGCGDIADPSTSRPRTAATSIRTDGSTCGEVRAALGDWLAEHNDNAGPSTWRCRWLPGNLVSHVRCQDEVNNLVWYDV